MELRQILGIFIRRWWVIIPTILIALTGALLFSYSQTPIYEAKSTFITLFSYDTITDRETVIYGLDTLAGQQGIFVTYCEIMKTGSVNLGAYEILNVDPNAEFLKDYTVTCTNLPETNVILLTVRGPSPVFVERLTQAIGLVGMSRTNALNAYYPLAPLDEVRLTDNPVSPSHLQNAVLGGAFGLILGITAALTIEYLRHPGERITAMSIRDPQIGIYNNLYFERRADEEIKRAHARNRPISIALFRIMPDEDFFLMPKEVQNVLIRKVAFLLEENVGQANLIAYLRPMLIGAMLVETPAGEANQLVEHLRALVRTQPLQAKGGFQATFTTRAGIVASSGNLMSYDQMLEAARKALSNTESNPDSQTHLVQGVPRPFMDDQELEQKSKGRQQKVGSSADPFTTNEDVS